MVSEGLEVLRQIEVDDPWSNPGRARNEIDVSQLVEAGQHHEQSRFNGNGTPGQAGSCSPWDDRNIMVIRCHHDCRNLGCGFGKDRSDHVPWPNSGILGEDLQIERMGPHSVGTQQSHTVVNNRHAVTLLRTSVSTPSRPSPVLTEGWNAR